MTKDHIITSEHQRNVCPYCRRDVPEDWESEHLGNTHYKKVECECGKVLRLTVNFMGTGDDSFNKKEKQTKLDDKIAKAEQENKRIIKNEKKGKNNKFIA